MKTVATSALLLVVLGGGSTAMGKAHRSAAEPRIVKPLVTMGKDVSQRLRILIEMLDQLEVALVAAGKVRSPAQPKPRPRGAFRAGTSLKHKKK